LEIGAELVQIGNAYGRKIWECFESRWWGATDKFKHFSIGELFLFSQF